MSSAFHFRLFLCFSSSRGCKLKECVGRIPFYDIQHPALPNCWLAVHHSSFCLLHSNKFQHSLNPWILKTTDGHWLILIWVFPLNIGYSLACHAIANNDGELDIGYWKFLCYLCHARCSFMRKWITFVSLLRWSFRLRALCATMTNVAEDRYLFYTKLTKVTK